MKKILVCVLFLFLATMVLGGDWVQTPLGSYKVENYYPETLGDWDAYIFLVSYKNTTSKQFRKYVTIRAAVYDKNENMLAMRDRSFFAHEYGTIKQGFTGTLEIPVPCETAKAEYWGVKILKAQ